MIDLSRVRNILREVEELIEELDRLDFDDTRALTDQSKGRARQRRAEKSQELQLLATRFELAASLVRVEYWHARGEADPLNDARDE